MQNLNLPFVPKGTTYKDRDDKIRLEARNGVIQAAFVVDTATNWNSGSSITPELLCELQRLAISQLYRCAGHFRDGKVEIQGVVHQPPPHDRVPLLVEEMCEYLNGEKNGRTPLHLASYAMWRVNWIHPFFGGNGRTARALSYLILCTRLGFVLPGTPTIPEQIVAQRQPYFEALKAADAAWEKGSIDLSVMEELMSTLLAKQLLAIHTLATGNEATPKKERP